jgi:3-hydroxyisobutyrate dehydrogenase
MSGLNVTFLGLGVMGGPMAGWLANKGHKVTVWNRTQAKAEIWVSENQGTAAPTIVLAVAHADMVMACVGDDPDALDVGAAAINAMQAGSLYVDHTTTSAHVARILAAIAGARGIGWVDAPVSGGQAGAVNGRLTAMCGSTQTDFDRANSVLEAYCANIVRIGEAGSGQSAKMVNQIAIAGVVQGLAEAVAFSKAEGLDTDAVLAAISKGAAGSWQMDNRWPTMVAGKFDFGFAVDWMRKDLRIVLEAAAANGTDLTMTQLVDSFYAQIQKDGGGRLDTSSLAKRLIKRSGIEE